MNDDIVGNSQVVGRPMEILLVEDSLTSGRFTIGALKKGRIQHRLSWMQDGEEAIEFLYRRGKYRNAPRPDVILLDLGLPKKDGREVLGQIKSEPELQKIPVVVLTASTDADDIANTERLQVQSYMTKPVDLDKFLHLIQELKQYWHKEVILPTTA
jgi:two-component system, chemotaxis family, response regulator Rcp1